MDQRRNARIASTIDVKNSLAGIFILLVSLGANAFPELIRHSYSNCTTCHFQPQGGGMLTPYGRSLSKEVLSTWSSDREEEWFHGALPEGAEDKVEEWLHIGGDVRSIQIHQEDASVKRGQFFLMQGTLRLGLAKDKFAFLMDIGRLDNPMTQEVYYTYATAYAMIYQFIDGLYLKAGRFFPNYGLNLPEHNLLIKQSLGLTPGTERDGASVSWLSKTWNVTGEVMKSPDNVTRGVDDRIYTFQVQRILADTHKAGVSLWESYQGSNKQEMQGVHGVFGFTPHFYALAELDRREDVTATTSRRGVFHMQRWGYEFIQGLHGLVMYQFAQSDMTNGSTRQDLIGPGIQFFPRPHFELIGFWNRVRNPGREWSDQAYALAHYYF